MKILITGGTGMLGTSLKKFSREKGYEILTPNRIELDLQNETSTRLYLAEVKPNAVIHTAARVGGISANIAHPFEFLIDNLRMDSNLLTAASAIEVPNLIYIGSSCMYPRNLSHAMREEEILTGPLEPTNESYALAKIVGWKIIKIIAGSSSLAWRTFVLSNLYGPNDHFNPSRSHLLAALIEKVEKAKMTKSPTVEMWGDGSCRREFTYVDDVSEFIIQSIPLLSEFPETMNLGAGVDYSVRDYYDFVFNALEYDGEILEDMTKPTGMKRKLMDITLAQEYGWKPKTSIESGIRQTVAWYKQHRNESTRD
jgi:GDP-L-fucose synthase